MGYGESGQKFGQDKAIRLGRHMLERRGYLCRRLLGQGAFSGVYCVEEGSSGRIYVCKISENTGLLKKEAQVLSRLRHPLFPAFDSCWQEAGLGFLLREYVPGSSLQDMLERRGRFSAAQTVRTGLELAEGLGSLHEWGERYLFRDVKPANIIVREDGRVKLIDFGCVCSREEKPGSLAGSEGFAAPEQLHGTGILTPACDVYGLGRTLKVMAGAGGTRLYRPPESRATRRRLLRILDECTAEDPGERIPDMEGVICKLKPLSADIRALRRERI